MRVRFLCLVLVIVAWLALPPGSAQAQGSPDVELVGQISGYVRAVAIQGDYAYVGVGPQLIILNIADPAHPVRVGQTASFRYVVLSVMVRDCYVYVAVGAGLRVIDVSDSAHPHEVGSCATPGDAGGVVVSEDYAYATDGEAGLRVINVADPTPPA